MANWYVTKDGKETGPFSDAALVQLAKSGQLMTTDLVRKDGSRPVIQAVKIKGLFPPAVTDAPIESIEPSGKPSRFKAAADAVARAAAIKKLELHDLPQADLAIGARVQELGIGGVGLTELLTKVRELEAAAEAQRRSAAPAAHETLADRAKRLAGEAKKRIGAEKLLKERKQKLAEIGRRIREDATHPARSQLEPELTAAQAVLDKIAALEAEDKRLGATRSPGKRLAWGAVAAVAAILVVAAAWDLLTTTPEEAHQATLQKIHADSIAQREALEARRAEGDRRHREQLEQAKAERDLAEAKYQAEVERRDRERTAANETAELAKEQERLRQEQEQATEEADSAARERAEAEKASLEEQRRQANLKAEHEAAQGARTKLADQLFSKVDLNLDHNFELGASLKKSGATIELRGPDLDALRQLLAKKDWLGLVRRLNDSEYEEYPEAAEIERAYGRLMDKEFRLLVKVDRSLLGEDGPQLYLITLTPVEEDADYEYPSLAKPWWNWEVHPDGIGFSRPWQVSRGPSILVLADRDYLEEGIDRLEQQVGQQYLALNQKVKLGEIDEKTVEPEMRKAVIRQQEKIRAAALKL